MKSGGLKFLSFLPIKRLHLFLKLLPLCVIAIAFLIKYKSPLDIITYCLENPKDKKLYYVVFADKDSKGNSECEEIKKTDEIALKYTLRKGAEYPYTGISFYPWGQKFIDLSSYDQIRVKLKATEGRRMNLSIGTNIRNYSDVKVHNTLRNNQLMLNVESDFQEIKADFSDFKTPEWWFTINQKEENQLGVPEWSEIRYINISHCVALPLDKQDFVQLKQISFSVNLIPLVIYSLAGCLIYYIALFFILRKRKEVVPVNFTYEKTEVQNHFQKEEEAVFQFITSNYSTAELSITDVVNATGLYEQKVSTMIRKKTDMNFKQFLNSLRIAEAKRLLRTSDLQVSEIAYKVGYGNVSHFNRVFKESEKCSPNDFRKQGTESTIS